MLKHIGIAILIVLFVFLFVFVFLFPFNTRLNVTYEAKYQEGSSIRIETVSAGYPLSESPDAVAFIAFFVIVCIPAIIGALFIKRMAKEHRARFLGLVGLSIGVFLLIHIDQISAMIENAAVTREGYLVGFRILGTSALTRTLWDIETFAILKLFRIIPGGAYFELLFPVIGALLGCRLGMRRSQ